jgi:flagellar basal-body rod modification protein FlgD
MSAVSGITGNAQFDAVLDKLGVSKPASANVGKGSDTLDQTSFLKLMTAQLKNQDPFKPVENEQMVAQMAQMSSVTGIAEMNTTLKNLATKFETSQATSATSYVGKAVLVPGTTAYPHGDGSITAYGALDSAATNVAVTFTDADGNVVKTMSLGQKPAGDFEISWDGLDADGESAGTGPYAIKVHAQRPDGTVEIKPLVWAPVVSVKLPADGSLPTLAVADNGDVELSAVRQVG